MNAVARPPVDFAELGQDAGRGNLLGVQPSLTARDYASADNLRAQLGSSLAQAASRGWLGPRTVAVFPEYIGAWLVAAGQGQAVTGAPTVAAAMRRLALRRALAFGRGLLAAREPDWARASLFRMQAEAMARDYQAVFSGLARHYGLTVAAGSTVLPDPRVEGGQVRAGRGPLYNTAAVFGPDGQAHPALARKCFPTRDEQGFIAAARVEDLPAFDTPAGRLGVLVCADAWQPAAHARLRALAVDVLAVPSFISEAGLWDAPWGGYNGAPAPDDVDSADAGRLTESQAWRKYALAGRLAQSGARHGVNVFLRGQLWDMRANSGAALGTGGGQVVEAGRAGAALVNVWL